MERKTAIFVDGIGASAATSGVLNALQGRIFGLLYLEPEPLALEDIALRLGQSKSNISINIRGLTDWHLVRLVRIPGSRRDHYQAATDLVRVMQEIMERRFRWNMRQVLTTIQETRAIDEPVTPEQEAFIKQRLDTLETFFRIMDATAGMLAPGSPFPPPLFAGAAAAMGAGAKGAAAVRAGGPDAGAEGSPAGTGGKRSKPPPSTRRTK
ncbi:MAG TPA: MarR family transcriptional regulator [Candidatus Binatia bacterium]|nr:MarR family transcriptional regulator [Candidatus Binatia bacterium]